MPYEIIKLGKWYVEVKNKDNGTIKSKKTTIEKARKQIKLLKYLDYVKKQNKYLWYNIKQNATSQKSR